MFDLVSLWDIAVIIAIVLAISPTFGDYMGRVYLNRPAFGDRILTPIESFFYRILGTSPRHSMTALEYGIAVALVNGITFGWIYLWLTYQGSLPYNPGHLAGFDWSLGFHTSSSFVTNTDFQYYTPESQLGLGGAVLALQLAMFISPATGLAVVAAFIRGFVRRDGTIGNFYVDLIRSMTRILLPLSILGAVIFVLLGVPQTFQTSVQAHTLLGGTQTIPLGPVASWQSIDLLGSNGGGFYSANAGSTLANPSAVSNLFEIGLMMIIPMSFPFAFAQIVRKPGEGLPYLGTVLAVLFVALALFLYAQSAGNPALVGVTHLSGAVNNGYPVGQETRFSPAEAGLFQVYSVYGNVGAANMQLGSLTPLAQLSLMFGMFTQSTPGGVGTGFGVLLVFALVAVFVGGLMVGRTPEYLGKKIEKKHMQWSAAILLSHPALVLVPVAIAVFFGYTSIGGSTTQVTAHNLTILLYAYTSQAANNGSAMAPINGDYVFLNVSGAIVMLLGRYFPIAGMLILGGLFARQNVLPPGPGTLRTRSATFTIYLTLLLIIITGLLFLPVMALGPLSQIGGGP